MAQPEEHDFEQSSVRGVVVDDEGGQVSQIDGVGRRCDDGEPGRHAKFAVKWKVLPLPASLSTQMRPPIRLHELRGDGQAQPGAAILPRRGAVGLRERLEDTFLTVQRDADAGVRDGEVQHDALWRRRLCRHAKDDLAWWVNLMALPIRLTRIWRRRPGSPRTVCGTVASTSTINSRPFW